MSWERFWRGHDWFWRIYDWVYRIGLVGFVATVAGGGVIGGIFHYDGWDPAVVLLAGLSGFAILAIIYIGFCHYWDRRNAKNKSSINEPELSLFDATREAYGQTRGTAISEAAERDSDNPLKWYASYFIAVSKTPLYGNVPYSPKRELIDPSGFDPIVNPNQIDLKERNGGRFWVNITIKRADFDIAIKRLISWGGKL